LGKIKTNRSEKGGKYLNYWVVEDRARGENVHTQIG